MDAGLDAEFDPPVDLPGFIEGVEPEAHSNHPPMVDANGVLYRVTETIRSEGNNPRMMKSEDGGSTWVEVDSGNRPTATDLEGCWQLQHDSSLYLSVASSNRVWFAAFHTSDAADRPDRWVLDERVEADLDNGRDVVQFSSLARTTDGQFWMFYSDTMVDGRHQIGFRRRSPAGEWSSKRRLADASGSWTSPRGMRGRGDVTHVFYKDHRAHRLYLRTLGPSGELSSPTRIDVDGTNEVASPHTQAVSYVADDAETITVAFIDAAGVLRARSIVDGVLGDEEPISSRPVLANPRVALNEGVVAHLALAGTTVHVVFTDRESGDVMHSRRAHGGSWSPPTVLWDSGDGIAWWVYANVYRRGPHRRLGFTYDVGEHADDVGRIEYDEVTLSE